MKLCECGCGTATSIARQSDTKLGYVKGQPLRFACGHSSRTAQRAPGTYKQRGHRREHVLIAEAALGCQLPRRAEVHHVDEDTGNNARTNLVICQDGAYHKFLHYRARIVRAGGNPNTERICAMCGRLLSLEAFNRRGDDWQRACRGCMAGYQIEYRARQRVGA